MHRAGLVDKHLRNPRRKGFTEKWLNDLIESVSQVFEVLNWGKEYERLLSVALELIKEDPDLKFKNPTRFPNNSAIVFDSFLIDLPAIVRSLEESQADEKNKNKLSFA